MSRWKLKPAPRQHQSRSMRWGLALWRNGRPLAWLCAHQHRRRREARRCKRAKRAARHLDLA